MPTAPSPFFWLHIKKSAGSSVRSLLAPWYVTARRGKQPVNFIQSDPALWNDILNNFRVPLGAYQFRRGLFARRHLYPASWDRMLRFAFVRAPLDRAQSMFFYLRKPRGGEASFVDYARQAGRTVPADDLALFDLFLDLVEEARQSPSIYKPVDLHFTTHTAPMGPDVCDAEGRLLLSHVFRVEDLTPALNFVLGEMGAPPRLTGQEPRINSRTRPVLALRRDQITRVETLYAADVALYEAAAGAVPR